MWYLFRAHKLFRTFPFGSGYSCSTFDHRSIRANAVLQVQFSCSAFNPMVLSTNSTGPNAPFSKVNLGKVNLQVEGRAFEGTEGREGRDGRGR